MQAVDRKQEIIWSGLKICLRIMIKYNMLFMVYLVATYIIIPSALFPFTGFIPITMSCGTFLVVTLLLLCHQGFTGNIKCLHCFVC